MDPVRATDLPEGPGARRAAGRNMLPTGAPPTACHSPRPLKAEIRSSSTPANKGFGKLVVQVGGKCVSHCPKETEEMQSPELEEESRKEEEEEGKRTRGGREWGGDKEARSLL